MMEKGTMVRIGDALARDHHYLPVVGCLGTIVESGDSHISHLVYVDPAYGRKHGLWSIKTVDCIPVQDTNKLHAFKLKEEIPYE